MAMNKQRNPRIILSLFALLAATLLASGAALAQDEGFPEAFDEPMSEEAPAAAAPAPAAAPAAGDAEAAGGSGWFRVDTDGLGTQIWFGATHEIGGLSLASDIFLVGATAELDIGPALSFGDLTLTPMAGFVFDFGARDFTSLVPQLITVWSGDGPVYFESWLQVFLYSPFVDGVADLFYTRNFLLYAVNDLLSVGPQVEISLNMNDSVENAGDSGLVSLPVGLRANVPYGKGSTFGLFLGYETQAGEGEGALAGRATFIHTW